MVHQTVDQMAVKKAWKWAVTKVDKMAVMMVDLLVASRVAKLTDSSGKYSERKVVVRKADLKVVKRVLRLVGMMVD